MAFSGNIQDLSLIDVLQLISQSGKTGIMTVKSENIQAQVFLKSGKLVDVKSEENELSEKLGTYLLNKDLITKEQLDVLLDKQNKIPVRFGTLMINEGYLTQKNLKKIMAEIIKEKFLKVLSIEIGTYDFEATIVEYNPDDITPMDLNSILLDILKDLDEIKLFRTKIQSLEIIYSKIHIDDEVLIDDKVNNDEPVVFTNGKIKLNKQSYFVHMNINGINTINDIVKKTVLSEHFVLKVIFLLYNAKKLKIPVALSAIKTPQVINKRKLINITASLGLIILLIFSGLSLMEYYNLFISNAFSKQYETGHKYKNHEFMKNLDIIYKIEYQNEKVNLKKLKINHKKIYYQILNGEL